MRIIEYPITLRTGYYLSNNPDATSIDDNGNPNYLGIQIIIKERYNTGKDVNNEKSEEILRAFSYEACNKDYNPEFEKHLYRSLKCENSLWKITRIIISNDSLNLEFTNEQLCNEYYRQITQPAQGHNDNLDSNPPRYREYVSAEGISLSMITLRFEAPSAEDGDIDVAEVDFSACGFAKVTEYRGGKRYRCYEIHPDKEEPFCFPTIVTEYM